MTLTQNLLRNVSACARVNTLPTSIPTSPRPIPARPGHHELEIF